MYFNFPLKNQDFDSKFSKCRNWKIKNLEFYRKLRYIFGDIKIFFFLFKIVLNEQKKCFFGPVCKLADDDVFFRLFWLPLRLNSFPNWSTSTNMSGTWQAMSISRLPPHLTKIGVNWTSKNVVIEPSETLKGISHLRIGKYWLWNWHSSSVLRYLYKIKITKKFYFNACAQ